MSEGAESLCCRTMRARTELSENMIKTKSPKNFAVVIIAALAFTVATPARAADATAVKIANFTFGPQELKVKAGTTVTWTNEDDMPHTVVSPNNFLPKAPTRSRSRHRALISTFVHCIRT